MIFHNVIELPLTDIFLFWTKLNQVSVLDNTNKLPKICNRAWRTCATARRVSLHYSLTWKEYFLGDQTFLLLISVILWLPHTDYEITYISWTGTSLVMLKLYFYYYLCLLTKLLIKQQIHPVLLKCEGTLELQNCCSSKPEVAEYKEPSSID